MVAKKRAEMMEETRLKLLQAARRAFAHKGYAASSMDDLTAAVGLTRGALYHHFGDKQQLLAAVVNEIDAEMASRAAAIGSKEANDWDALMAEGVAYIEMALQPEVQRIVLLDGPAFLGDPAQWPSQNACLTASMEKVKDLIEAKVIRPVDVEAAARLLNGAALNAALWIAASDDPKAVLTKAVDAFRALASGMLVTPR